LRSLAAIFLCAAPSNHRLKSSFIIDVGEVIGGARGGIAFALQTPCKEDYSDHKFGERAKKDEG
jgi:hypothetical protein